MSWRSSLFVQVWQFLMTLSCLTCACQHSDRRVEQSLSSYQALDSAMPNEIPRMRIIWMNDSGFSEHMVIHHHPSPSPAITNKVGDDHGFSDQPAPSSHHHMLVLEEEFANSRRRFSWVSLARVPVVCLQLDRTYLALFVGQCPQTRDRWSRTGAYLLRGGSACWTCRFRVSVMIFSQKLQKMSLAEIGEKYRNIIRVNVNNYTLGQVLTVAMQELNSVPKK